MYFPGKDGARLAYEQTGEGRPLVLIHGHLERGAHWIDLGVAGRLATHGYQVIMPDLRGHGESDKSHDAASYPADVLAHDGLALIDHLGLVSYDLAGHSLGGRTVARMLIGGAAPHRAVISGQDLETVTHAADRTGWGRNFFPACGSGAFEPGSTEQAMEDQLLSMNCDPRAQLLLLDSWVNTTRAELAAVTVPTLVLTGADDTGSEVGKALADALGNGRHVEVPGDHFAMRTSLEWEEALTRFLAE
jgi:pimeloyl-ACP methyl ester carboxylesterase